MRHCEWTLEAGRAKLQLDQFSAVVNLHSRQPGLDHLWIGDREFPSVRLLAIDLASAGRNPGVETAVPLARVESSPVDPSVIAYVRGGDLVATFEETAERPLRIQAYWRAGWTSAFGPEVFGVDLEISVQTSHWHACPQLQVFSLLATSNVAALSGLSGTTPPATAHSLEQQLRHVETVSLNLLEHGELSGPLARESKRWGVQGPGCLLFRQQDAATFVEMPNYVEIVHPVDFRESRITATEKNGVIRVEHPLFPESLEKGVILRARLRGAFVGPDHDAEAAIRLYRAFVDASPPLTA